MTMILVANILRASRPTAWLPRNGLGSVGCWMYCTYSIIILVLVYQNSISTRSRDERPAPVDELELNRPLSIDHQVASVLVASYAVSGTSDCIDGSVAQRRGPAASDTRFRVGCLSFHARCMNGKTPGCSKQATSTQDEAACREDPSSDQIVLHTW